MPEVPAAATSGAGRAPAPPPRTASPTTLVVLFLAFAAAVVGLAYGYRRVLERTVRASRERELAAIAQLKVDQVEAFRRERLGNGRTIHENPGLSRASWPLLDRHDPAEIAAHLDGWFGPLASHYGYADLAVLDDRLRVMARWDGGAAELPPSTRALAQTALRENEVLLSDPAREPGSNALVLDLAVPLVARVPAARDHVAGVMVLRSRVEDALGPLVARWPAHSDTGEAFLAGRRGDRAVYFTDPQARGGAGAEGVTLDHVENPVVQAALGHVGVVEGRDRSGTAVVAAVRGVPGTDWVLVAKMDASEVLAPMRDTERALAIATAALLASAAVSLTLWRHRQLAASRRDALAADTERLEHQFEALFEAGNDAVLLVDEHRCIVAANDRAAELYAWTKEDMTGRRVAELAGRDGGDVERSFRAAQERGGVVVERVHRRRDGTPFPVEASIRPYRAGARTFALAIVRDVSERRRSEAQLRQTDRLTAMGALAAGVAHEINNPLSFVLGNLEWAIERVPQGERPEAVAKALREARDGAQRVQSIVRDLKTFSRAEDDAARRPVDVVAVLRSTLNIARSSIRHRARVVTDLQPVRLVEASEQRLGQVFLNLLLNAAEAIPPDAGREQHVFVGARDAPDGVVVEVRDTGDGMSPEVLRRIFDPFFTTKPDGTGLGLSICHGIVRSLGGRIEVESEPGRGSAFRVVLPPAVATARATARAAAAAPAAAPAASGGRVLIVDDEPLVASSAARLLGRAHQVVTATNARDALGRIEAGEDFDVILCDLMMPGMTGMELWEALARLRPGTEQRMVFVTGGTFTDRAREFLETTANAWLEKPFEPGALRQAVAEHVQRRRSEAVAG